MIKINMTTDERIIVDVKDLLSNVTDLAGSTYNVYTNDDDSRLVEGPLDPAETIGLRAFCKIDTNAQTDDDPPINKYSPGMYRLYLTVPVGDEAPVLGPVDFEIESL